MYLPSTLKESHQFYPTLVHARFYLKYIFLYQKAYQEHQESERVQPFNPPEEFNQFPKNIQNLLISLSKTIPNNIGSDSTIAFLEQLEKSGKPLRFLKTHPIPPLIAQMQNNPLLSQLARQINANHMKAQEWMHRAEKLERLDDGLELLIQQFSFPIMDIILGFIKNPIHITLRGLQLRAKHHDPFIMNDKNLAKGVTFLNTLGLATSTIGLSALALGGSLTGVAIAPISLFIYASISSIEKLFDISQSVYELFHAIKQKEPRNTHNLRIADRALSFTYNIAGGAFKILLTIAAFIAITNPLGLVLATTLLTGFAFATLGVGAISLWGKNRIKNKIDLIQKGTKESQKKKVKQDKIPKTKKYLKEPIMKYELNEAPILREAQRSKPPSLQEKSFLTRFHDYSDPNSALLWEKQDLNPSALKQDVSSSGIQQGIHFDCVSDMHQPEQFKIIRHEEGGQREIAKAYCHLGKIEYHLSHHELSLETEEDRKRELSALLLSIKKNKPLTLTLHGDSPKELLLIYQIALELDLKNIVLAEKTLDKIRKVHPQELKALEDRHLSLKESNPAVTKPSDTQPKPHHY